MGLRIFLLIGWALCLQVGCTPGKSHEALREEHPLGERSDQRLLLKRPVQEDRARSEALVVDVAIAELLSEYKDDEARADRQFKGKTIQTVGIVSDVQKDLLGSLYVGLGTGRNFESPEVWCYVRPGQEAFALALPKGTRVAARGTLMGLMINLDVRNCTLAQ
jgi:tRNA_anti-like